MSRTVPEVAAALAEVLRQIDGLRVHTDPSATVVPPAVVIGPPALGWAGYCPDMAPTRARFALHLVLPSTSRTLELAWQMVPQVAGMAETVDGVTLADAEHQARPGVWPPDLPAYQIDVDVAL